MSVVIKGGSPAQVVMNDAYYPRMEAPINPQSCFDKVFGDEPVSEQLVYF